MLSVKSTYLHTYENRVKVWQKSYYNCVMQGKKSVFKGPIDTIYLSSELTSKTVYVYEDDSTAMHKR